MRPNPGTARSNIPHTREGIRVRGDRQERHEGYPNFGLGQEEPHVEHDLPAAASIPRCVYSLRNAAQTHPAIS